MFGQEVSGEPAEQIGPNTADRKDGEQFPRNCIVSKRAGVALIPERKQLLFFKQHRLTN